MNIYDFDDTIYDGDTFVDIIKYSLIRHPLITITSIFKTVPPFIKYKKKTTSFEEVKETLLSFLFKIENKEEYINQFIDSKKHKIKKWYYENQKDNDLIISASYELWIRPFCNEIGIKNVIATKTDKNGKIIGKNCKRDEKVKRLYECYPNAKIIESYSDSKTDIPMLEIALKPFIVKKDELIPYNSSFKLNDSLINRVKTKLAKKYFKNYIIKKNENKKLKILKKENIEIIKKYKEMADNNETIEKDIYVFWYQNIENAPLIVKACIKSIKENSKGFNVHILNKDNYSKYVTIENNILNKFNEKKISITHFSDILRFNLIKQRGGIWVDATLFVTDNIFEEFSNNVFNSIKLLSNQYQDYVSKGKWTAFFVAGSNNCLISRFMVDIFNNYWKNHDELIDYFLVDYSLELAYRNIKNIRNEINCIEESNINIYNLCKIISEKYDKDYYCKLLSTCKVHKLSYKVDLKEKCDNKITYYGKIINDYNKSKDGK